MSFKLSRRSLDRLEGIDERLQAVVKMAITLTKTDFGVVQGMRTLEQQKELVAKGASKTLKSKHLEGKAFDIMAFVNGRASWELNLYDDLADAIKEAAIRLESLFVGVLLGLFLKRVILWISASGKALWKKP